MTDSVQHTDIADYSSMLLIRRTEELILRLFSDGKVSGTTHTCIGQEANAVGVIGRLDPARDFVVSNHRCHGHFLAFGGSVLGLLGEILGSPDGICGGRGGSQHLECGHFTSNGILAGSVAAGCGLAMGEELKNTDGVVAVCIGDGALGEGVLYECLNMAALWSLPVIFFVENNRYAQTTPVELAIAGSIAGRAQPFGIESAEIDTTDVQALRTFGGGIVDQVRRTRRPMWAVVHTYRFSAHSKGDDTRPVEEIERYRRRDPLLVHGCRLSDAARAQAEYAVARRLDGALARLGVELPSRIVEA